jgi:hypothetical protein
VDQAQVGAGRGGGEGELDLGGAGGPPLAAARRRLGEPRSHVSRSVTSPDSGPNKVLLSLIGAETRTGLLGRRQRGLGRLGRQHQGSAMKTTMRMLEAERLF